MKSNNLGSQINLDDCGLVQDGEKNTVKKIMQAPPIQEKKVVACGKTKDNVELYTDLDCDPPVKTKEVIVDVPLEEIEKQELEKIEQRKKVFINDTDRKIKDIDINNKNQKTHGILSLLACCVLFAFALCGVCFSVVSFFEETFLSTEFAIFLLIVCFYTGVFCYNFTYKKIQIYCSVKEEEKNVLLSTKNNFLESLKIFDLLQKHIKTQKDAIEKLRTDVENLITFPADKASLLIASRAAEFVDIEDKLYEQELRTKSRPAHKAADEVKRIRSEKRDAVKKAKLFEHQVQLYETLFPWLSEYTDVTPQDIKRIVDTTENVENEYESVREWLSPDEYSRLSNVEKYQLALDRYTKRQNKSKWEIGIEYERYIGYLHECDGYLVDYSGAMLRLEDMGRDLIARKGKTVRVIQCKRWSKEKTIHENHIFQLYGTCILLGREHPNDTIIPVFYTTTTLSETAKYCAKMVGVELHENVPFVNYPVVKCNISQKGEKIYHLPFDQQYDRVKVSKNKERRYVETVADAERLGFRRAHKWIPTQGD